MLSFMSSFENTCVIVFDIVFDAEAATVNSKGTKLVLANYVSTVFISAKPTDINGLRKLRNPLSWLVIFVAVSSNSIPLFSKDLITFIIYIFSLLVNAIPEPSNYAFLMAWINLLLYWFYIWHYSGYVLYFINNITYCPAEFIKSRKLKRPNCIILEYWVFENFILTDEPFAKASRIFETCVLVNNNLWGKLILSLNSPTAFHELSTVTSVLVFIPDFNLLSCELGSFTFAVLYWVILP